MSDFLRDGIGIRAGLLATSALLAIPALPAQAQTAIENENADNSEIIVTAQKRAERLQDVPISITAVTGQQVEKSGIVNLKELTQLTTGLTITNTGPQIQPTIRGITSLTTSAGQDNNVAFYVDGVYQATSTGLNQELLDLKSIQVLKGPQGTLFGRNSTAGAILIDTLDPSFETSGRIRASYGRFNEYSFGAYVTGPIVKDVLAIGITGNYRESDGYLSDIFDRFHPGKVKNYTLRGKLLFQPNDDMKFIVSGGYARVNDPDSIIYLVPTRNPTAFENPGLVFATKPGTTSINSPTQLQNTNRFVNLTSEFDLGFGKLKSITAFSHEDSNTNQDADGTTIARSLNVSLQGAKTFTQEINLGGTANRLDWVLGAFYFRQNATSNFSALGVAPTASTPGVPSAFRYGYAKPRAWAVFADGTFRLTDRLAVIGGVRYSWDKKVFGQPFPVTTTDPTKATALQPYLANGEVARSWHAVTPRASLRYEIAENTNIYASFSKGFKAGAYGSTLPTATVGGVPTAVDNPADPEKATAFEIGFKTAQRRWRLDVAAFHYDYKDLQVQSFTLLPPPAPPILASQLTNAASSEIYGVEISGSVQLTDYLTVNAGLAWTHARYKNFTTAQGFGLCPLSAKTVGGVTTYYDATGYVAFSSPTNICNDTTVAGSPALPAGYNTRTAGTIDRSGDPMVRAPEWNANLAIDWRIPTSYGQIGLNGTAFYSSEYALADLSPTGIGDKSYRYVQPAYVMLNAQLSLAPKLNENFKFTLWGRNLANETIYLSASGSGGDKYTFAAGRTYGVQIEYSF